MTILSSLVYSPGWESNFVWLIVISFIFAFAVSYGMGANDACNDWGTSVGAGTAYILCAIFNTLGAVLLGYKVTETIRTGIVDVTVYDIYVQYEPFNHTYVKVPFCQTNETIVDLDNTAPTTFAPPDIRNISDNSTIIPCARYTSADFMYGQVGTLLGVAVFMIVSSIFKIPVSATHAIVGATLAATLDLRGTAGIKWAEIGGIVASWFISPVLAGFISSVFYTIVKFSVLMRKHTFEAALTLCPVFMAFTLTVNLFAVIFDGSKYLGFDKLPWWAAALISLGIGIGVGLIIHFPLRGILRRRAISLFKEDQEQKAKRAAKEAEEGSQGSNETAQTTLSAASDLGKDEKKKKKRASISIQVKPAEMNGKAKEAAKTNKEKIIDVSTVMVNGVAKKLPPGEINPPKGPWYTFLNKNIPEDPLASKVFNALHMVSASLLSFTHGANDTANTVGPLVAIWLTYQTGWAMTDASTRGDMQLLLAYGAVAMIAGFVTLGYRTIQLIANEITSEVSAPSGFTVELGTAFTVLFCAKLGIPVSSTHCAVGAVVFVGMTKSTSEGVSWKVFSKICVVWLLCFPISAAISLFMTWLLVTVA